MTCEKLIHGHRAGRLVKDKETGQLVRVGRSENHPYKCGRPAERLKVKGFSYEAFAVLCVMHKKAAEKEGSNWRRRARSKPPKEKEWER